MKKEKKPLKGPKAGDYIKGTLDGIKKKKVKSSKRKKEKEKVAKP